MTKPRGCICDGALSISANTCCSLPCSLPSFLPPAPCILSQTSLIAVTSCFAPGEIREFAAKGARAHPGQFQRNLEARRTLSAQPNPRRRYARRGKFASSQISMGLFATAGLDIGHPEPGGSAQRAYEGRSLPGEKERSGSRSPRSITPASSNRSPGDRPAQGE